MDGMLLGMFRTSSDGFGEIIVHCRLMFLFTLGGAHPQSGKQRAHFDPSRGSPFVLPENIFLQL